MAQLTQENQSLMAQKTTTKDPANDKEALDFWNYLEKDNQDHVNKVTQLQQVRLKTQQGYC
jgi:hypothetical protein